MRQLNIGIDMDGVTYDFTEVYGGYLERKLRRPMPMPTQWDYWNDWGITKEFALAQMAQAVHDGVLWWQGSPMPGALEGLESLKASGHHVVLLTDRRIVGAELEARLATYSWLSKHAIPHDDLIITRDKSGLGLDILFDDAPHHISNAFQNNERAVFLTQPWNASIDHDRVDNWEHFLQYVEDLAQ